jgi:hypothetical protein
MDHFSAGLGGFLHESGRMATKCLGLAGGAESRSYGL